MATDLRGDDMVPLVEAGKRAQQYTVNDSHKGEAQQDFSTYAGAPSQEIGSYRRRLRDAAAGTQTPPSEREELLQQNAVVHQHATVGATLEMNKPAAPSGVIRESARHFHEYILRDPNLLLHKATYVILYSASGFFTPYVALLLADAGADKAQIGAILAIRPFVLMVANPLWGRLADSGYRRSIMVSAIAVSATLKTCSVFCTTIPTISFFIIIADVFGAPMYSLLDASVLAILDATSVTSLFGNTRLMGSIGFGGFAPVAGWMADNFGMRITACTQLVFALPAAMLASFIPVEQDKMHPAQAKTAFRNMFQADVILVLCITCIMVRDLTPYSKK
jgi:predicted MFS family arabinose efflux permease